MITLPGLVVGVLVGVLMTLLIIGFADWRNHRLHDKESQQ